MATRIRRTRIRKTRMVRPIDDPRLVNSDPKLIAWARFREAQQVAQR
jgi:hypothetical protein